MKIAYFGKDIFFSCMQLLIQSGHEIITLFSNTPESNEYDFTQNVSKQAELLGIPIRRSYPTKEDIKHLEQKGCDMLLSAGYPYKIPEWQGTGIRYGINIHPSLLPEGAGPMPLPFIITKGLKKSGVTLHELSPEWDAGNIILQESFPLFGSENIEDLLTKKQRLAVFLLRRFLESPEIYWMNSTPQIRQDEQYWPMPNTGEFVVDYTQELEIISRCMRAHRYINPAGDIEFISNVYFWEHLHNFAPGTILLQDDGINLIAAQKGLIRFKLERKPSPKYDFFTLPKDTSKKLSNF
jgi:methionyl-tRNA formyltransferase